MHGHHDSDHYDVQFTTRQLVLLFGLLIVIVVGVFVGGIVIGRGMAPGMADTLVARRAAPVPPAAKPATGAPVRAAEARAEDALRLPIQTGAEEAAPAPPPAPKSSPARAGAAPAASNPAPGRPTPATSTNPEQLARRTLAPARPARSSAPASSTPAPTPRTTDRPNNAGSGKFTIQVAAFRDRAAAERMLQQLAAHGIEGYLEGTPAGIFRVRVGHFETREAARSLAARLESEQFATLVTSR